MLIDARETGLRVCPPPCTSRLPLSRPGEALYAFELALSLEKLNFQKLRALHVVADVSFAYLGACLASASLARVCCLALHVYGAVALAALAAVASVAVQPCASPASASHPFPCRPPMLLLPYTAEAWRLPDDRLCG